MRFYAIKLVPVGGGGAPETVASVRANDLSDAIAAAMARYPGMMVVDGVLQASVPDGDDDNAHGS